MSLRNNFQSREAFLTIFQVKGSYLKAQTSFPEGFRKECFTFYISKQDFTFNYLHKKAAEILDIGAQIESVDMILKISQMRWTNRKCRRILICIDLYYFGSRIQIQNPIKVKGWIRIRIKLRIEQL
jgi:hypothetical protein